jgi:hypothetical protein
MTRRIAFLAVVLRCLALLLGDGAARPAFFDFFLLMLGDARRVPLFF